MFLWKKLLEKNLIFINNPKSIKKRRYKMEPIKNWREILEKGEESMSEQEKEGLAKRYHKAFEARQELYKLMKKVIYETETGEEDDDYCKALHLYLSGRELIFDPYYQSLSYDEEDIAEHDLETVEKLISEISKRYNLYKQKTKKNKGIAEGIFNRKVDLKNGRI